jgi:hypothetical protein
LLFQEHVPPADQEIKAEGDQNPALGVVDQVIHNEAQGNVTYFVQRSM